MSQALKEEKSLSVTILTGLELFVYKETKYPLTFVDNLHRCRCTNQNVHFHRKRKMWKTVAFPVALLAFSILKRSWIISVFNRIKRDFVFIKTILLGALEARNVIKENQPVYKRFERIVKRHPNKPAIIFNDETWTFAQIRDFADRVAIYFEEEGYSEGDCIALLLNNCPEYVAIWLGLSKLGVITALVNTNLGIESLVHSFKISQCKGVIYGLPFEKFSTTFMNPELRLRAYQFNRSMSTNPVAENAIDLSTKLKQIDSSQSLKKSYSVPLSHVMLYIYTSGTTGMPKAAIVTHLRYNLFRTVSRSILQNMQSSIFYCPMPLYHLSGVGAGMGPVVLSGTTIVIKEKFSASNYWKDCKKYKCNVGMYIGEMLRYVLLANKEKEDHCLDLILGNGLKPDVWKQFLERFNVKRVLEFYGATEGNFALVNLDNTPGTLGYVPSYMRRLLPFKLIRFSEETEEPIRDKNGLCIECKANEPGLAVAKVTKKSSSNPMKFVGYSDEKENEKKMLHDVSSKGDCFFNSGDVLMFDQNGYYYFVDRIGDTFRWKGENVSTTEIESIICKVTACTNASVYGVQIPGTEGKAGMAMLTDENSDLDVDVLGEQLRNSLASYAIPIFVRIVKDIPLTSTFKLQKFVQRSEGFNINVITDPVYFFDPTLKKYVPLTEELHTKIMTGVTRM